MALPVPAPKAAGCQIVALSVALPSALRTAAVGCATTRSCSPITCAVATTLVETDRATDGHSPSISRLTACLFPIGRRSIDLSRRGPRCPMPCEQQPRLRGIPSHGGLSPLLDFPSAPLRRPGADPIAAQSRRRSSPEIHALLDPERGEAYTGAVRPTATCLRLGAESPNQPGSRP